MVPCLQGLVWLQAGGSGLPSAGRQSSPQMLKAQPAGVSGTGNLADTSAGVDTWAAWGVRSCSVSSVLLQQGREGGHKRRCSRRSSRFPSAPPARACVCGAQQPGG